MHRKKHLLSFLLAILIVCLGTMIPRSASATKFMGLKEAIKYFLPEGSKVSKVSKSIPKNKYKMIEKRFRLQSTEDFKETLSEGPYTVYIGRDASNNANMYILILEQYWRTCYHKYAIGIEPNGKIKEVVVVELNCRFANPINRKSFLKQFKDKKATPGKPVPIKVGDDVDIVSGATMSSQVTAIVSRRALALFETFFAPGS